MTPPAAATATAPTEAAARTFGRSRAVPTADSSSPRKRGWGAAAKVASSVGAGEWLKIDETKKLLAFANPEPFDWNSSHWCEFIEGQKSVICWDSLKDDDDNYLMPEQCPICAVKSVDPAGKPSKLSVFFNVISLENIESPALKIWEVGMLAFKDLQDLKDDPRTSPLNKEGLFFQVSKPKDAKSPKIVPIKGRDFMDDFGFPAPSHELLAELAKDGKTSPVKEPLPLDKMREIAAKLG